MKYKVKEYKKSSLSEYCPYLEIIDDTMLAKEDEERHEFFKSALVQLKDGSLMIVFKFIPPVSDNSSRFEENTIETMSKALSLLSSRWTVHFDTSFIKPTKYYDDNSANMLPLSAEIEKIRIKESITNPAYVKECYLSLSYSIQTDKKEKSEEQNTIDVIYQYLSSFTATLRAGGFILYPLRGNDLLSYLHYTLTLSVSPVKTSIEYGCGGLDELLTTEPMDATVYPIRLGNKYLSVLSVDNIKQNFSRPDNLSAIFSLGFPLRLVLRYGAFSPEESDKIINKKKSSYNSKIYDIGKVILGSIVNGKDNSSELDPNTKELSRKEECEQALEYLVDGDVSFGYYTGVLILFADTEKDLRERKRMVVDTLTELEIIVKDEHLNAFCAFLSSLPGEKNNNPRQFLISSDNASSYMTLSRLYSGEKHNNFLQKISGVGSPLMYGYTWDNSPYFFNLNASDDDVGHTLIVGTTGSGKSFLLSLIASSWSKYPDSRVVIFDKGLSAVPLAKGNGGRIILPGKDKTVFNPLIDADKRESDCLNFLNAILDVNKVHSTGEEKAQMHKALTDLYSLGNNVNLSTYQRILKASNHRHSLSYILDKYTDGDYGYLFNNTTDNFINSSSERLTLIELGYLMNMGNDVINPALIYMFDRLTHYLEDKKPTLLILDECWLYLMNEIFRNYIVSLLKTMRKYNCFVILATQEIEDVKLDESTMRTILSQVATRIYLSDKRANKDEAISQNYTKLGLSEYQKNILSIMRRKKDYYIIQDKGESVVDFKAESIVPYLTTFNTDLLR